MVKNLSIPSHYLCFKWLRFPSSLKDSEPGTALHNLQHQLLVHNNVSQAVMGLLFGKHAVITSYLSVLAVTQGKFDKVSVSCNPRNNKLLFVTSRSLGHGSYSNSIENKNSKALAFPVRLSNNAISILFNNG